MKRHGVVFGLFTLMTAAISSVPLAARATESAHKGGCIVLTTVAETEQVSKASDGTESKTYVPAKHVVPDSVVVWTTSARNVCAKGAEHVVINQPVPEHMNFVADSAVGGGTQIALSVDGKDFHPANQLTVREQDGSTRPARATDVHMVRWTLDGALAPQDQVTVRYRAVLQ